MNPPLISGEKRSHFGTSHILKSVYYCLRILSGLTNGKLLKILISAPAEKENLCLYGLPDETWEVNLPVEEVPPELPEPALGINFARDGMQEKDWLSLVAVHSDSWLLAVAFYFGARFGFGKNERYDYFGNNVIEE